MGALWLNLVSVAPAVPYQLTYMGRMTEPSGKPVAGPVDLEVSFYRGETGGDPISGVGPLSFNGVTLKDGVFQIGIVLSPIDFHTVFADARTSVFLEITDVTHQKTYPRQSFSVVPYALKVPVDTKTVGYNGKGEITVPALAGGSDGQVLSRSGEGFAWVAPTAAAGPLPVATNGTAGAVKATTGKLAVDGTGTITAITADSAAAVTGTFSGDVTGGQSTTAIAANAVTTAKLANGAVTDAKVSATAAIATSKLSGPVTAISGHGLGTAATQDVGTAAGNVVQLLTGGKLPAVDGSNLTNLPAATVDWTAPGTLGSSTPNTGAFTTLTTTGNVGIGTPSPSATLDVTNSGLVSTARITYGTTFTDNNSSMVIANNGTAPSYRVLRVLANSGNWDGLSVSNAASVGIGASVPAAKLDVVGSASNAMTGSIVATSGSTSITGSGTAFDAELKVGDAIRINSDGAIHKVAAIADATHLTLATASSSTGTFTAFRDGPLLRVQNGVASTKLMVDQQGNVGIGTASPTAPLEISSTGTQLRITNPAGPYQSYFVTDGNGLLIRPGSNGLFQINDGSSRAAVLTTHGASGAKLYSASGHLTLQSNAGVGLYIDGTDGTPGYVGVGTTTPGFALDVVGDVNTSACFKANGTNLAGGCASDARFKTDVRPLAGALKRIALLNPVRYRYRADEFPERHFGRGVEYGFIAQELESVFPEFVTTDADGYKQVHYGLGLQMQTIAAVKELKSETEAEIRRLRVDNAQLKADSLQKDAEIGQLKAYLCMKDPTAPFCPDSSP